MGICSSCDSTNVATAKLILDDGTLQEFPYPVKVSYVLQKNPSRFICNSDEMDFDDVVSPVSDDEELQLGQLYFALPLSRLKHRLQAEDMAALAVKASSALAKSGADNFRSILVFSDENVTKTGKAAAAADGGNVGGSGRRRRRSASDGGQRGKFAARLIAIPE